MKYRNIYLQQYCQPITRKIIVLWQFRSNSHECMKCFHTLVLMKSCVAANHENNMFWKQTWDGFSRVHVLCGFSWNTRKVVSNVNLALCQTHCKQVPVFSRLSKYHVITWSESINHSRRHIFGARMRQWRQKETSIPPVPTSGSIWVVLWLSCFWSAPYTFPQRTGHLLGAISGSP